MEIWQLEIGMRVHFYHLEGCLNGVVKEIEKDRVYVRYKELEQVVESNIANLRKGWKENL
jgi:hypothetical protein